MWFRFKTRHFTLAELVCVLAITMSIMALVTSSLNRIPAILSFKDCVANVESVLDKAVEYSETTGHNVLIYYDNRKFHPHGKLDDQVSKNFYDYITYKVPDDIIISFKPKNTDPQKFIFFPDGPAVGPQILLEKKGHIAKINISRLTGDPIIITND